MRSEGDKPSVKRTCESLTGLGGGGHNYDGKYVLPLNEQGQEAWSSSLRNDHEPGDTGTGMMGGASNV